jgi:hypothetical protein
MASSILTIAVSISISATNLTESKLCDQIRDIEELDKQSLISEVQLDYRIDNTPQILVWDSYKEEFIIQKDSNSFVLLK